MRVFPVVAVVGLIGWSVLHPAGPLRPGDGGRAVGPSQSTTAQDFRWTGRILAGDALEIRGVNGDVVAEAASGDEVVVEAVKRAGRRGDPDDVRIDVVEHEDGVTICAVYPARNGSNECRPGGGRMNLRDNDTKVTFHVRLPAGVRFLGHTVNGDVDARGLRSDVEAHTVNGGIDVSTTGHAEARTVNGSIRAELGRADWTGGLDFTTVNGSITVTLPAGASADVEAQTVNGRIESDFPLTVTGRFSPRRMHGVIGEGGRELRFETVNGSIKLRRGA